MSNGEGRLAEGKGLLLVQLLLNSSWSLKEQRRERERGDGGMASLWESSHVITGAERSQD